MAEDITHEGVVKRLTEHSVVVGIVSQSACASCHAKGACTAADMQDKEVEVRRQEGYQVGDRVLVLAKNSQGFLALFYAYLFPFVILLALLIGGLSMDLSEGLAALISLASLAPYYFVLYMYRDRLRNKLEFEIKSI